ncbi:Rod shape-determining protein MreC [Ignavibacterium album JCM 16511]|uniref:Cell shape-determining protein MreC n=1 Tax=Ignavibacterium album (strain DSM 19864 / JCM 16511 / NBRC 101810 / Mat9-16) TaxID=945713 RepID=I0AKQ0_IGNAJ|nr:rod shape-determining protein MreC [Ignavibacterium album]AFH49557.1 Rod shape-determining protein MreC [Ignavibacterium album JCM 16511]
MIRFLNSVWYNFKEYIILTVLVILSLFIISQNHSPAVQRVRAIAFGTFATVTSVVSDVVNIKSLKKENEQLRETNAKLMLQLSKLREAAIINEELKGLVALKDTSGYPLIPASVVSKSLSRVQGTITLNVGNIDSVKVGMPVITDKGLVGIIYSVSGNYSIARTLQNVDLKITVKDERTRENGLMKWNGENLVIVNVPKTFQIKKGDRIITSELSSLVPFPVPVGVAAGSNNIETGIFNEIKVIPFVDFAKVENVFVIKTVASKEIDSLELNFLKKYQ